MQSKVKIRAATKADVLAIEGKAYAHSFRGVTAELDGRVIGVAGVMYSCPAQCFSNIKPELKKHKRAFVEAIKILRDILSESGEVYANASQTEATAPQLLRHAGFIPITRELYKWHK